MQILLTPRAEKNFDSIVQFLQDKWGERSANQFIIKTDQLFKLLQNYPTMGQIEIGEIRGFQLTHQTRIMYTITAQKIIILSFFDVRQNPDKRTR